MVKAGSVGPGDRVVTCGAVGRGESRPGRRVRWVVGLLPGREVAAGIGAIGRSDAQRVIVVDVALRAA